MYYFPGAMETDGERLYIIIDGEDRSGCQQDKMQLHVANFQYPGFQMNKAAQLCIHNSWFSFSPYKHTNQVEIS